MVEIDQRLIRASFGTTKYCSFFLKGLQCKNKECLYMHSNLKSSKIFTKEMMSNKAMYQEQEKIAFKIAEIESQPLADFMNSMRKFARSTNPVFPPPEYIYQKKFFFLSSSLSEHQEVKSAAIKASTCENFSCNKESHSDAEAVCKNPRNKFKFIKLNYSDDEEEEDTDRSETKLSTYDNNLLDQILEEFNTNANNEFLNKYRHSLDCLNEESVSNLKPARASKFVYGVPLYTWSYQKLPDDIADNYEKTNNVNEWKNEQYHVIKQLMSNTKGKWLYDELRGSKR